MASSTVLLNKILWIILDNVIWVLLLIPLYIIYEIYRAVRIVANLYKSNRRNNCKDGGPKHVADRLLEIYSKNSRNQRVKYGDSNFSNPNLGIKFFNDWNTCQSADDILIQEKLVTKLENGYVIPNTDLGFSFSIFRKMSNRFIYHIFKFISVRIYHDKVDLFSVNSMKNIFLKCSLIIIILLVFIVIYATKSKLYMDDSFATDTKDTQTTGQDDIQAVWPEKFFDFGYEQEFLKHIRDLAMQRLSEDNQGVRFCGSFFDVYDNSYKLQRGELGDCAEFGTGESRIIRTKDDNQTKEIGSDQGKFLMHIKTDRTYKINNFSLKEIDVGDYDISNDVDTCEITITNLVGSLFTFNKDDFRCGSISSVEYGDDILLIVQDYAPKGNQYTGEFHILYIQGNNIFNIGTISTDWYGNGLQAKDFWVDNGNVFFTFYDGRYEWKYGPSHNSSTYSFIPRVFKITPQTNSILLSEGTKVSNDVKNIYIHQLDSIRESFRGVSTSTLDASTASTFIPYWVGISRYILTENALLNEFKNIKDIAAKIDDGNISVNTNEVDTIYSDIASQQKVITAK